MGVLLDPELRNAFPQESIDDICKRLSRQIRRAKWCGLKEALEQFHFNEDGEFRPQDKFCKDLIDYLDFKTKLWTELLTKSSLTHAS
jgi:hypothetical protein